MPSSLRLSAIREQVRGSLWSLPTAFVVVAVLAGTALSTVQPTVHSRIDEIVFGGTADGARSLLEVIAGAMITVTALSFSLTVIALQMSAGQYSPRVLRNFLSDLGNKLVLSVLLATFAYCLAVLRMIRAADGEQDAVLPSVAVTGAVLLSFLALGMLVFFIHHLTQQLRIENIMREITGDTLATIDRVHPGPAGAHMDVTPPLPADDALRVRARRSGYLQAVELEGLVEKAAARHVVVHLRPPVGAFIAAGTTLAWLSPSGQEPPEFDADVVWRMVHDHVHIGKQRTMQQDITFGIRQLTDVAAKALSTGMNDPTTAVDTIGHLSVIASRLATRQLGPRVAVDGTESVRVVLPRPGFADHLDAMCSQPRRYGATEPAVLLALLRLLADAAEQIVDAAQQTAIEAQVARTMEVASRELDDTDMTLLHSAANLVAETMASGRRPSPSDLVS